MIGTIFKNKKRSKSAAFSPFFTHKVMALRKVKFQLFNRFLKKIFLSFLENYPLKFKIMGSMVIAGSGKHLPCVCGHSLHSLIFDRFLNSLIFLKNYPPISENSGSINFRGCVNFFCLSGFVLFVTQKTIILGNLKCLIFFLAKLSRQV